MTKTKDLTGQRFERLQVIGLDEERNKLDKERRDRGEIKKTSVRYLCKCDCDNICSVVSSDLRNGHSQSCGCLGIEKSIKRSRETNIKQNKYEFLETHCLIFDIKNIHSTMISIEDYEKVSKYCWSKSSHGYWVAKTKNPNDSKEIIQLHQLICQLKDGEYDKSQLEPDHLNRNRSDNTRENLELKSRAENMKNKSIMSNNTSGKAGVSWAKDRNKWGSHIRVNGKSLSLGYYIEKQDAINARLEAEIKYGFIGE